MVTLNIGCRDLVSCRKAKERKKRRFVSDIYSNRKIRYQCNLYYNVPAPSIRSKQRVMGLLNAAVECRPDVAPPVVRRGVFF
jgi:hypothetical protein